MKKLIAVLCLCSLLTMASQAQVLSITGFGGYTFQDRVSFGNAYGYINAGGHWGVSMEGISPEGHGIELYFQQQRTHAPIYTYNAGVKLNPEKDNLTLSYIMLNGVMYHQISPTVQPYGGIGIGVGIIASDGKDISNNPYSQTQTRFAWNTKMGVKIKTGSVVGIKLQAQLFSIIQASGGGFYVGSGSGAYVNSYSSIWQFGFTGGLCFDLKKK